MEMVEENLKEQNRCLPYCRVVDDTAQFLFSYVSYQEHQKSFIKELQSQNIDETLVGLLNCENKHVINALAALLQASNNSYNPAILTCLPSV